MWSCFLCFSVHSLEEKELYLPFQIETGTKNDCWVTATINLHLGKRSIKVSQVKKLLSDDVSEPPAPLIVKANDDSMKSNYGLYSANPPLAPPVTKPAAWCFPPPPGNQWLVPAMSPSEGLIYKPYTGSYPPPTSPFMSNTVYGVPASHQWFGILPGTRPLGQTYFSLYGLPVMNQSRSSSGVEETSPFAGARSNGPDNQSMVGDINFTMPQQSSCNMSSEVTQSISFQAGKFPASKESELQGSGASSPSDKAKGDDALPLFPTAPTVHALDQNVQTSEHRTQVIKVIPHNPRSATQSAFRIFRSIQEERKQV
jgi:EARLY FLOWERING 3 protein